MPSVVDRISVNPLPSNAAGASLDLRGARSSSVIVHRVPTDCVEPFLEWQRGITQAAAAFPGYQATDLYPPAEPGQPEWVVVIHFDGSAALERWLEAPVRAEWTAKLPAQAADFKVKTLTGSLWLPSLVSDGAQFPHWKVWLAVVLCLYPIVMLMGIYISPHTTKLFGLATAMLLGNLVSVAIIEWGTSTYRYVLGWWFRAVGKEGRLLSLVGLILILAALALMAYLFSLITG